MLVSTEDLVEMRVNWLGYTGYKIKIKIPSELKNNKEINPSFAPFDSRSHNLFNSTVIPSHMMSYIHTYYIYKYSM